MLSSSLFKIHYPGVTGVSPRPTDRLQHQRTAKHERSRRLTPSTSGPVAVGGPGYPPCSRRDDRSCVRDRHPTMTGQPEEPELRPDPTPLEDRGACRR
jgi:hypothetical protein